MQPGAQDIPFAKRRGDVLFAPGTTCAGYVVLQSGVIRVSLTAANGREVVLYRVEPGDVCLQTFGCLMQSRDYAAEGVAETDVTGYIVPTNVFRRRLAENGEFRDALFAAVTRRFQDFEQLVEDVALIGFDARLARVLLRLGRDGDRLDITHDRLAAETASGRAFVSRRLAEFQRRGLVEAGRGTLRILDRGGLEEIAEDAR